jgi:exo-1,4-beta-D-glucosaminidase
VSNSICTLLTMALGLAPCCLEVAMGQTAAAGNSSRIELAKGWLIQSSVRVTEKGDVISSSTFQPREWYPSGVPSTVVAALVNNKVYPDPYFGMNLRSLPGTTYNIGQNFANLPMPADSPFAVSWWYRSEFKLPANQSGRMEH